MLTMTSWQIIRWQNDQLIKWPIDKMTSLKPVYKMTSLQNDQFTKWPVYKMTSLQNDQFTKWPVYKMTNLQNDKLTCHQMTKWPIGTMTNWQNNMTSQTRWSWSRKWKFTKLYEIAKNEQNRKDPTKPQGMNEIWRNERIKSQETKEITKKERHR